MVFFNLKGFIIYFLTQWMRDNDLNTAHLSMLIASVSYISPVENGTQVYFQAQ